MSIAVAAPWSRGVTGYATRCTKSMLIVLNRFALPASVRHARHMIDTTSVPARAMHLHATTTSSRALCSARTVAVCTIFRALKLRRLMARDLPLLGHDDSVPRVYCT